MCGIAGIYRRTDADIPELNKFADELLRGIASRGRDATGYMTIDDSGSVQIEKSPVPTEPFIAKRRRMRADTRTVLLHTRWATVGEAKNPNNAHPVVSGDCYATHNGTIYNADDLFETFGMPRLAQVDSEVIPALVNVAGWDQVGAALGLASGGAAVAIVNGEKPKELILARVRDFPLVYVIANDFIVWASTESVITTAWKKVFDRKPKSSRVKRLGEGQMLRVVDGVITPSKFKIKEREQYRSKKFVPTTMAWEGGAGSTYVSTKWEEIRPNVWAPVIPVRSAEAAAKTFGLLDEHAWGDELDMEIAAAVAIDRDDSEDEDEDYTASWCDDCGEWSTGVEKKFDSYLCPECMGSYEISSSLSA